MAGSKFLIHHAAGQRLLGAADWAADNHYMILCDASHVPSLANTDLSHVSADELAGGGDYAPQNLAGEVVNLSAGIVTLDATNQSFGDPVTISAAFAYILEGTVAGKASTDKLVGVGALNLATAINPNAAAAVNKGAGKVGIPATAHGLSSGVTILIAGTVNYDGFYAVDATTTANEIVIVATFVAETFSGAETIQECLVATSTAGPFTVNFDAAGLSQFNLNIKQQLV